MIADGWRGAGLASSIMRALIRDARARGLKRMEGHVLAENRSMLDLARRLGFAVGASEEGPVGEARAARSGINRIKFRNHHVAFVTAGAQGVERPAGNQGEARAAVVARHPGVALVEHVELRDAVLTRTPSAR